MVIHLLRIELNVINEFLVFRFALFLVLNYLLQFYAKFIAYLFLR